MGAEVDTELIELRRKRMRELMSENRTTPVPEAEPPVPIVATSSTFPKLLAEHPRLVVDVWAPWCGPCRYLSPTVEALAKEMHPQVRFAKVNADEEPQIAGTFGVEAIPTLLYFQSGRLVDRSLGAMAKEALRERIAKAFGLSLGQAGRNAGYA